MQFTAKRFTFELQKYFSLDVFTSVAMHAIGPQILAEQFLAMQTDFYQMRQGTWSRSYKSPSSPSSPPTRFRIVTNF
jgi:hypothetical protein